MLPQILKTLRDYLIKSDIEFDCSNRDGWINSINNEETITKLLKEKFPDNIIIPKARHWYDILIKDNDTHHPVNIKITAMINPDNVGNLAQLVYAYTDYEMNFENNYMNGEMSEILYKKLKKKKINTSERDYYFLVINKNNTKEIFFNSVRQLTKMSQNANNLPFQISWKHNKIMKNNTIEQSIAMFIECIFNTKTSWQFIFLSNIKKLH